MNMFNKKVYFFVMMFFVMIVLSGCVNNFDKEDFEINQIDRVEHFTVSDQNSYYLGNSTYVWSIKASKQTNISSKVGWRVNNIYVKKWDKISKWDILAELDWQELSANYTSTNQMLSSLNMMYANTNMMYDSQIMAMEQKVDQAKLAMELDSTLDWWAAMMQIEQTKLAENTANSELIHTQNVLEQKKSDLYANTKTLLSQTQVLFENIGIYTDEILGMSDSKRNYNDSFEIYLSAKNTSYKNNAKNSWSKLNGQYNRLQTSIKNIINWIIDVWNGWIVSTDQVYNTLSVVDDFALEVRNLLELSYNMLDASVTSSTFTQETIDNYKNNIVLYQNKLDQLWLKKQKQAIDNFNKESEMQLDLLSKKKDMAQNQYEIIKTQTTKWSEISQKQYQEALAWLNALRQQKSMKLAEIKAQIDQIQGNQNVLEVKLDDTKVVAPYDWVVVDKFVDLWQVVSPGMTLFNFADQDQMLVEISVPESKLSSLNNISGVNIHVTSIDKYYTWYVYTISPSSDSFSKKITVEFTIDNLQNELKLWMYCEVFVPWLELDNTMLENDVVIPYKFVFYDFGEPYVLLKDNCGESENCLYNKKYIKLLWCDWDYCQIQTWLSYGSVIVKP